MASEATARTEELQQRSCAMSLEVWRPAPAVEGQVDSQCRALKRTKVPESPPNCSASQDHDVHVEPVVEVGE